MREDCELGATLRMVAKVTVTVLIVSADHLVNQNLMPTVLSARDPGDEDKTLWEVERLEELGYDYPAALELALAGVSWHDAQGLMVNGATPAQAASILLP